MNVMLTDRQREIVQTTLTDELGVPKRQLTPEAAIGQDLGADSLDKVEIAMNLEAQLAITLPDEDWDEVQTVGDLCAAVATCLAWEPASH
jgi:acyl carrier protein